MMNESSRQQIEVAILGECLRNNKSIDKILNFGVTKGDFYSSSHQEIFETIVNTYKKHGSADIVLTVKENEELSISYLSELLSSSMRINIKSYVKILKEFSINRKYIEIAAALQNGKIKDGSTIVKKVIEETEEFRRKINSDNTVITMDSVKIIDIRKAEKVKTGFKTVDDKILGFLMGSLNIITGYNGGGKSTLINQMCIAESLSQGYKVFAYSPELTNSNLKSWLYPTLAIKDHFITNVYNGIEYKTVGAIGINAIDKWIKDKLFLYSDDSVTNSATQLLRDMEYLANEKAVRVFIIDNLMKLDLETSKDNELQAQKKFVNKLKMFAREYNALIHLVAHPKKPSERGHILTKYDIAGSGDITNLADYTMGVIRIGEKERAEALQDKGALLKDCILKILKDRPNGSSDFGVDLDFDRSRKRFYETHKELDKDYGYTRNLDMVQVEIKEEMLSFGDSVSV